MFVKYSWFFLILFFVFLFTLFVFYVRRRNKKARFLHFDEDTAQIYVGNLPYHAREEELRDCFYRFGPIKTIRIIKNFRTGQSKGYAFIRYTSIKSAQQALSMSGRDFKGRALVVQLAKTRDL